MAKKVEKAENSLKETENNEPLSLSRNKIFEEMLPATQEAAQKIEAKLSTVAKGIISNQYEIGLIVKKVREQEATYGSRALEQLADYLNFSGGVTAMYALQGLVETYNKDYLQEQAAKPMANGELLTVKHFVALAKVKNPQERETLLAQTRKASTSSNQLKAEITASYETQNERTGGRKPQVPESPLAAVTKLQLLLQKLINYIEKGDLLAIMQDVEDMTPTDILSKHLVMFQSLNANFDLLHTYTISLSEEAKNSQGYVEKVLDKRKIARDDEKADEDEELSQVDTQEQSLEEDDYDEEDLEEELEKPKAVKKKPTKAKTLKQAPGKKKK